jgi:hypothetical protein
MRQLLVLSLLLLGVSWAAAQNSPSTSPKSSASAGSGAQSVEGCLSGSDGKYMLTDKQGQTYDLTGDTSKLAEHVGHEVKITGTQGSATGAASSQGGMTLEVSSVKHISKTCKNAGGGGMAH